MTAQGAVSLSGAGVLNLRWKNRSQALFGLPDEAHSFIVSKDLKRHDLARLRFSKRAALPPCSRESRRGNSLPLTSCGDSHELFSAPIARFAKLRRAIKPPCAPGLAGNRDREMTGSYVVVEAVL